MSIPHFIDIELFELDDTPIPAAIAWSLPDGRIKSALIEPDDRWLQDVTGERIASLDYLFEEGLPLREIVRELTQDVNDDVIYHDGVHPDQSLLEMIFDAVGKECPYEVQGVHELLESADREDVERVWRMLVSQEGLSLDSATDGVFGLLLLAREYDLLDFEAQMPDDDPV